MSEINSPMDGQKNNPIKYGFLKRIDGTKGMFMLYPDVFAACITTKTDDQEEISTPGGTKGYKYSPEIVLSLEQAQVRDEDQSGQPSFTVVAGFASISVIADTVKQRDEWVTEIRKAIDSLDKKHVVQEETYLEKPQESELMDAVADFFTKNPRALLQRMYQKHKRNKSQSESENGDIVKESVRDSVVKKGYLKKNGAKMMSSKLRWFVLRRKTLSYFETEACENKPPQGIIELNSQVKLYDSQKHSDGFRIGFPEGSLYLQADSVSEKMDWVGALRKCINSTIEESASCSPLTQRNISSLEGKRRSSSKEDRSDEHSEEERASSNSNEGCFDKRKEITKISQEYQGSSEEECMTRSTSMAVFPDERDEVFDISDADELDWAEAKSANDWALIEGWLQEFASTVKNGNDTLRYDMKKALNRLKKGGTKPFIVLGNDLRRFNRRLTGQMKKTSISEGSELEMKKTDKEESPEVNESDSPGVSLPINCGCAQHYENKLIDQVVSLSCSQLFDLIYDSNSAFNIAFAAKRGVKDSKEEVIETMNYDQKESWKKRRVSYYHLVNNPIAKSPYALCIESQNLLVYEENQRYVLEVESNSPEVPYGDYFTAVARYCISFESPKTSKIVCHVQLVWKKSSALKGFVAKLALGALKDHMRDFMQTLINSSGAARVVQTSTSGVSETDPGQPTAVSNQDSLVEKKEDQDFTKKAGLIFIGTLVSFLFLYTILPNMFGSVPEVENRMVLSVRCGVFSAIPVFTSLLWSGQELSEVNHFFKLTLIFILNIVGLSSYPQMINSMNIVALFTVYQFIGCVAFFVFHYLYDLKGVRNPGYMISVSNCSLTILSIMLLSIR